MLYSWWDCRRNLKLSLLRVKGSGEFASKVAAHVSSVRPSSERVAHVVSHPPVGPTHQWTWARQISRTAAGRFWAKRRRNLDSVGERVELNHSALRGLAFSSGHVALMEWSWKNVFKYLHCLDSGNTIRETLPPNENNHLECRLFTFAATTYLISQTLKANEECPVQSIFRFTVDPWRK